MYIFTDYSWGGRGFRVGKFKRLNEYLHLYLSQSSLTRFLTVKIHFCFSVESSYLFDEVIWCRVETRSHMVKIEWIELIDWLLILWNQQRSFILQEVVVSFSWRTTYLVGQLEPKTPVVWPTTGVTSWSDRSDTHEDPIPDWYRLRLSSQCIRRSQPVTLLTLPLTHLSCPYCCRFCCCSSAPTLTVVVLYWLSYLPDGMISLSIPTSAVWRHYSSPKINRFESRRYILVLLPMSDEYPFQR